MAEEPTEVIAYAGYRGEESPRSFVLHGRRIAVTAVLARWIEEDGATSVRTRCFRVKGNDMRTHLLRQREPGAIWTHEALAGEEGR
ncbi:MAG TPA: hypothetical protein VF795_06495 [Desulfuromonadaceae bacterium]